MPAVHVPPYTFSMLSLLPVRFIPETRHSEGFFSEKKKGEENELMQVNVDEVTYLQNLVISNLISIQSGVDFYTGSFFGRG